LIAYESGVPRTADPLGGSYYLESLTNELDRRATRLMSELEDHGIVEGIADGSFERAIADAAYTQELAAVSGERTIVGVNRFVEDNGSDPAAKPFTVGPEVLERQLERLAEVRERRDDERVALALSKVQATADSRENVMPALVEAVSEYATVGEISDAFARVFSRHRASTVI
jgi:methylmalonyl-CoA mutase N-terminal domain/subunit